MPHRLSPIEIAEGALLADLAVICQLLAVYLPIGGNFFQAFIPTIFAVLVLRRGLYVGVVALCVALFVVGVITGAGSLLPTLLPCGAGLFLGQAMKHRLPHWGIVLLGVTGGALTLAGAVLLVMLLAGISPALLVRQLQGTYRFIMGATGSVTAFVGLGEWWRGRAAPALDPLARQVLAHWWAALLAACWLLAWPLVLVNYSISNSLLRLLGYDVRPFPGKKLERLIYRATTAIFRRGRHRKGGVRA
jgi:uncharacterized protein YybS (DUF2232 family)